jgi:histidyl-tRNA synthetase
LTRLAAHRYLGVLVAGIFRARGKSPMPAKVPSVKGFRDILPAEARARRRVLGAAVAVLERYGFEEIELPLLERGDLFARSVGATSDIVEKEMYAFEDRDGTLVALRPEGTASVVRAYLEAGLNRAQPVARLYYHGPMFRRERPQKGRYRQFTQIGAELMGRDDPQADAETLCLVADICADAGLGTIRIEINSLGDAACRPAYREALAAFARSRLGSLCEDCRNRIDRNPLRILDCKNPGCRAATTDAPMMVDFLCAPCAAHREQVLRLLCDAEVTVVENPRMVRGLDYYCRTAFEISAPGLGAQDAIGGGGRYDGLVAELGGPEVSCIGFAFGVERMLMAAEAAGTADASPAGPEFFVAPITDAAGSIALRLARRLRGAHRVVELGPADRKLKAQMKLADRAGARWVVIIGDEELARGRAGVRDLVARTDYADCVDLTADGETIAQAVERKARREA